MKHKIALFCLLIFFVGCGEKSQTDEKNGKEQIFKQKEITNVNLTTINNLDINITKKDKNLQFEGIPKKATLVVFFATWCPSCKAEIPSLNNLNIKYQNYFQVVGVLLEDINKEALQSFVKKFKINYEVTIGKDNFNFANMIGGVSIIPFMILYDKEGNYKTHYTGAVLEEMIQSDIKKVIK